jgi:hypothetical protein
MEQMFPKCDVKVDHSQSLDEAYEPAYDDWLKEKRAKSVRRYLREGWDGDLVISDVDFYKEVLMGTPKTGVYIGKEVAKHTKRLYWCELLLMTRYAEEQPRELHREMARIMPDKSEVVQMDLTDEGQNWSLVAQRAQQQLQDAFAVRYGVIEPPSLYRIVLFRSQTASAVCLTVWDHTGQRCLYRRVFDGMEQDILMTLYDCRCKFIEMDGAQENSLRRRVKNKMDARHASSDSVTATNIRNKIRNIRDTFLPSEAEAAETEEDEDPPEIKRASKIHDGDHVRGRACGGCVIFRPERHTKGYGFGGAATLIEVPENEWIEDVCADPVAAWKRLSAGVAAVAQSERTEDGRGNVLVS